MNYVGCIVKREGSSPVYVRGYSISGFVYTVVEGVGGGWQVAATVMENEYEIVYSPHITPDETSIDIGKTYTFRGYGPNPTSDVDIERVRIRFEDTGNVVLYMPFDDDLGGDDQKNVNIKDNAELLDVITLLLEEAKGRGLL